MPLQRKLNLSKNIYEVRYIFNQIYPLRENKNKKVIHIGLAIFEVWRD